MLYLFKIYVRWFSETLKSQGGSRIISEVFRFDPFAVLTLRIRINRPEHTVLNQIRHRRTRKNMSQKGVRLTPPPPPPHFLDPPLKPQ